MVCEEVMLKNALKEKWGKREKEREWAWLKDFNKPPCRIIPFQACFLTAIVIIVLPKKALCAAANRILSVDISK